MTRYALIDAAASKVLELRDWEAAPPDLLKAGTANPYWVPYEVTDPAFDPATQVRSAPVRTVLADKVTDSWTVRAKSAAELDADKEGRLDGVDLLQFELGFDHENRIRALEGKAAVTRLQFRAALKARLP